MPVRNAAPYIREAVDSVLAQDWPNWELLVVDNGSTDGSLERLADITDRRLHRLHEPRPGVSTARNHGLARMQGAFYCFLDADDRLPRNSLRARAMVLMADPGTMFADGRVLAMDHGSGALSPLYSPGFRGVPFDALMAMDGSVFFGPSWMVRRTPTTVPRFPEHMRHAEDLAFYLSMGRAGRYDHTDQVVLHYRKGHASAMTDLDGLWAGYRQLYGHVLALRPPPRTEQLGYLWTKARTIMCKSYLRRGRWKAAIKVWLCPRPTGPQGNERVEHDG